MTLRSAVSNGARTFLEGDSHSVWARRYRDIIADQAADLGGAEHLSAAQLSLIRRAAAITCALEGMEGAMSKGEDVDLDTFTRGASHLRRILETLGVERKPKDITPPLRDYLAGKTAAEPGS